MGRLSVAVIAAASAVAFAQIASAADLPVKAPRYAPPLPPPYNWTGFYVGGNIGYSWGHTDSTVDTPDLAGSPVFFSGFSDSLKPNGIIGGGQIGYNWQVDPRWVLGIEADFQGSGQKDSNSFSDPFTFFTFVPCDCQNGFITVSNPGTATFSHEEKLQWFGTVRGRVGYIFWNNGMVYATGGLAYGHVKSSVTAVVTALGTSSATFSDSETKLGWTVGAGVEGQLFDSRNWTWKVEYLYMDLGTANHSFSDPTFGSVSTRTDVTDNIVRFGINYRFY
ncbi:MAG TPA: outer membrane protein [Pseudolabrys sp.]